MTQSILSGPGCINLCLNTPAFSIPINRQQVSSIHTGRVHLRSLVTVQWPLLVQMTFHSTLPNFPYKGTHLWIASFQSWAEETQLVRRGISFHDVTHWSSDKDPYRGSVESKFLEIDIKAEQGLPIVSPDGEGSSLARTEHLTQKGPRPPQKVLAKARMGLDFTVYIFWTHSASPVKIEISGMSVTRTKDIHDWHPRQWLIASLLSAYLSGWLTNCDW